MKNKKNEVNKEEIKKKPFPSKDLEIKILSNFYGNVSYSSKNGTVSFDLNGYGSYDYVTFGDLIALKNGYRRYFQENWIVLDDTEDYTAEELYKALRVDQYYNNILNPDKINELFQYSPAKIKSTISNYPKSMKETIYKIAVDKYKSGKLDSVLKIKAIEDSIGKKLDAE